MLVAKNIYFYQVTLATVRWLNVSAGMPLGGQLIYFPDLNQHQLYLIHPSHKNPTTSPAFYSNGLESFFFVVCLFYSCLFWPLMAYLERTQRTDYLIPSFIIFHSIFLSLNIPSLYNLFLRGIFPHFHPLFLPWKFS